MDTITHGIAGALIAKAFFSGEEAANLGGAAKVAAASDTAPALPWNRGGRIAIFALTLGSVFPDIDVLSELVPRQDFAIIQFHRGVTHSLVCLPIWAVLLAMLTSAVLRRRNIASPDWLALAGLYAVGLASHILLDLITSFGTMIWSPLSHVRPAWDLVFIIDFTMTAIALLPQLAAWAHRNRARSFWRALPLWTLASICVVLVEWLMRAAGFPFSPWAVVAWSAVLVALFFLPAWRNWGSRVPRSRWCRGGVYAFAGYLLVCAAAHQVALRRVERFAAARGLRVERIGAMPMPPSVAHWDGLIRTPSGVHEMRFTLLEPMPPAEYAASSFFPDSPPSPYLDAARKLREVRTYLWFARFPVYHVIERPGQHVVEFSDLRFFSRRARPLPFTYRVAFDASGRLLEQGWVRRAR